MLLAFLACGGSGRPLLFGAASGWAKTGSPAKGDRGAVGDVASGAVLSFAFDLRFWILAWWAAQVFCTARLALEASRPGPTRWLVPLRRSGKGPEGALGGGDDGAAGVGTVSHGRLSLNRLSSGVVRR